MATPTNGQTNGSRTLIGILASLIVALFLALNTYNWSSMQACGAGTAQNIEKVVQRFERHEVLSGHPKTVVRLDHLEECTRTIRQQLSELNKKVDQLLLNTQGGK